MASAVYHVYKDESQVEFVKRGVRETKSFESMKKVGKIIDATTLKQFLKLLILSK